jgi:hypothetical protein
MEALKEKIFSSEIIETYKMNKTDFTRNRKQSFAQMILMMINCLKKTLAIEIDNFIKNVYYRIKDVQVESPTKSAFVQQRKKINPAVFKELSDCITENYYGKFSNDVKRYKGLRLLAVDGSKITLPDTEVLRTEFGTASNQHTRFAQGLCSVLYDPLNKMVIDSVLESSEIGERELALRHFDCLKKNDLVIYDRGYTSYEFIYESFKLKSDFLIRASVGFNNIIKAFVKSGKTSEITFFIAPKKHQDKIQYSPLKVRLIRVVLSTGEIEVLITSLLDEQKYPSSTFKEIYFIRWGVETLFDELKNKLKLEHFSGYTKISILQDFYCAVFISNIQSLIINDLDCELLEKSNGRKYQQKINVNQSYGFLKNRIIELLWENIPIEDVMGELTELFLKNTVDVIPNRSNPRNNQNDHSRKKRHVTKNHKDAI